MAQAVEKAFTVLWVRLGMPHCVVCRSGGAGLFVSGPFPVVVSVGRRYFGVNHCAPVRFRDVQDMDFLWGRDCARGT